MADLALTRKVLEPEAAAILPLVPRLARRFSQAIELTAADVMTGNPATVEPRMMAAQALNILEQRTITALVVVQGEPSRPVGLVHLHDLWRTEMV